MTLAVALTPLMPLINSGLISVQDGSLRINQTVFFQLPAEEQQATLRRFYLQLVRNEGDREITAQVQHWALKPALHSDEEAKRLFLQKLQEEISRIFKPGAEALGSAPKVPSPPAPSAAAPAQKFYPELWDKLPRTVRIRLMRHSVEERLEPGDRPHAAFLASRLCEWLQAPDERNVADAEAVIEGLNREPIDSASRRFFWEAVHKHSSLNRTLDAWLQEAENASRKKILRGWISGLIVHLTQTLMSSRTELTPEDRNNPTCTLHPKWQQNFSVGTRRWLAHMAGRNLFPTLSEDPARHGRLLAQGVIAISRYALSLDSSVGRPALPMRDDETVALREILSFVREEAASDLSDWPFLRAFWMKLSPELKDQLPVMLEHVQSDVRKKRT